MNDDSSLSHTRWNCKYHIVFVPKYRRKAIYGKLRAEIGAILRQLCAYKDVEIIEAHAMLDFNLCTGLRIGELCALTWNDVDVDNGVISVRKTN